MMPEEKSIRPLTVLNLMLAKGAKLQIASNTRASAAALACLTFSGAGQRVVVFAVFIFGCVGGDVVDCDVEVRLLVFMLALDRQG